jgi:formylmethanofuran dehydrogenase subunit D
MSGFELDIPEDIGGGSAYLEVEGKYHATVSVMHIEKMPNSKGDDSGGFETPIAGGFSVSMEVLAGDQADKKFNLVFWGQKFDRGPEDKGNVMSKKKQAAFAIACDLVDVSALGKKVEVNLEDAVGSQVVVEIEFTDKVKDGKVYKQCQLVWANIYHVDDPRAKGAVMNEKLLASIPAANRHKPEYFDPIVKRKQSSSSPASPSTTRVSDADLDDI